LKLTIHLKGLNGLRAFVALGAVFSRITHALQQFGLNPYIFGATHEKTPRGLELAGFGVSIFFSLSGFLITYLLLKENENKGINVKNFYLRRICRIWPLYYLYFILCLIVYFLVPVNFTSKTLLFYIFFAADIPFILNNTLILFGHYWSIGVQEQFYLIWPLVIKRTGTRFLSLVVTALFLLIVLKIYFRYFIAGGDQSLPYRIIHIMRFQCMMIGALGAILFYNKNYYFLKLFTSKIIQLLVWSVLLFLLLNRFHIASVLDNEFISVVALAIIIGQITEKNRVINLENKVCVFLGKISYSIYVIHPLIIFIFSYLFKGYTQVNIFKYIVVYFSIISTTILLSYITYTYFEKIFINKKNKFSIINTSQETPQLIQQFVVNNDVGKMES
jgi:peptidoglycan/LPS O-acetylase OafA/YrhL